MGGGTKHITSPHFKKWGGLVPLYTLWSTPMLTRISLLDALVALTIAIFTPCTGKSFYGRKLITTCFTLQFFYNLFTKLLRYRNIGTFFIVTRGVVDFRFTCSKVFKSVPPPLPNNNGEKKLRLLFDVFILQHKLRMFLKLSTTNLSMSIRNVETAHLTRLLTKA